MIIKHDKFRVQENIVKSGKVIFIFTAMGTKIGLYRLAISRLNKKGYSCIIYDYPIKIVFNADFDEWQEMFTTTLADARKRLGLLKQQGARHFYAYGVSMGTLFANKFTRETSEISHVVLNLTYGDIADNVWTYRGVKKTKMSVQRRGQTHTDLRQNVAFVDPIVNAAGLRGKRVMLQLSRPDKVIVYEQARWTREAFEAAGLDLTYIENKYLGHFLGGTKNMLAADMIDKFYSSQTAVVR